MILRALAMLLCMLICPAAYAAATHTFTGMLVSDSFDRPIPIVVEFYDSGGKLMGNVKTSSPLTSAPVPSGSQQMLGDKIYDACDISSDIGNGLKLNMSGSCTSTTFQGKFQLYYREQRVRNGTFALNRVTRGSEKRTMTESERHSLSTATNTMCLNANGSCLMGCSRLDDSSGKFLCANTCRRKLIACRAKGKKQLEQPMAEQFE